MNDALNFSVKDIFYNLSKSYENVSSHRISGHSPEIRHVSFGVLVIPVVHLDHDLMRFLFVSRCMSMNSFECAKLSDTYHPHSVTTQPFWICHWEFLPLIYTTRVTLKKRTRRVAIRKTGRTFQCVMTSFYETCTTTSSISFEALVSSLIYHRRSTTVVLNWQTSFECVVTKQIVTWTTSRLSRLFSVCSPNMWKSIGHSPCTESTLSSRLPSFSFATSHVGNYLKRQETYRQKVLRH